MRARRAVRCSCPSSRRRAGPALAGLDASNTGGLATLRDHAVDRRTPKQQQPQRGAVTTSCAPCLDAAIAPCPLVIVQLVAAPSDIDRNGRHDSASHARPEAAPVAVKTPALPISVCHSLSVSPSSDRPQGRSGSSGIHEPTRRCCGMHMVPVPLRGDNETLPLSRRLRPLHSPGGQGGSPLRDVFPSAPEIPTDVRVDWAARRCATSTVRPSSAPLCPQPRCS